MNALETLIVNSRFRAFIQHFEMRRLIEMGQPIPAKASILEIGCGRGVGLELIFESSRPSRLVAFDLDPEQLNKSRSRIGQLHMRGIILCLADSKAIPSHDGTYDAVFDFGVLHHIPSPVLAIKEISRVLKRDGQFFFSEPLKKFIDSFLVRKLALHPPDAQFSARAFLDMLAESNLQIIQDLNLGDLFQLGVARKTNNLP